MPNKVTFAGHGNGFLNKSLKLDEGHSPSGRNSRIHLFHDILALFGCGLLVFLNYACSRKFPKNTFRILKCIHSPARRTAAHQI